MHVTKSHIVKERGGMACGIEEMLSLLHFAMGRIFAMA